MRNLGEIKVYPLLFFIVLISFQSAWGQLVQKDSLPFNTGQSPPSIFKTLANDKVEKLTIETDIKALLKGKSKTDPEYQAAFLSFNDENDHLQEWEMKIRVRGKRRKEYCSFPPVKIKFRKAELEELGFARDFNDLKIVTHCTSHLKSEDYVMREYLIYKMYNLLTDYSFRVKLIEIEYIDTKQKVKPIKAVAFIIENTDEMASRIGGVIYEEPTFRLSFVKNEATAVQDVFQYMIGNTDYKINAYHNIKMIKKKDAFLLFPVPYDFDYSGLVNTSYSTPAVGIKSESVRERFFLGYCIPELKGETVFSIFMEQKEAMFSLIDDFEFLHLRSKKFMKKYLGSFFSVIRSKSARRYKIINKCIK